jgi:hypothetical protein
VIGGGELPALLKKIDDLELSVHSASRLKNRKIIYLGDLVQMTESDLLGNVSIGNKGIKEIKDVLMVRACISPWKHPVGHPRTSKRWPNSSRIATKPEPPHAALRHRKRAEAEAPAYRVGRRSNGHARWERQKANVGAAPAGMLDGRSLVTTVRASRALP